MTKVQQARLREYNRQRASQGLPPVDTLATPKRTTSSTTNKLPDYTWRTKMDRTRDIPSLDTGSGKDATARSSMMEVALSGKEAPDVASEIIRKGKCLAPAYNKGAVQYVGSIDQAQDAGRKK